MNYLNELKKVARIREDKSNPFGMLFDWFSEMEYAPTDDEVHKFAEIHGIDTHELENYIYEMIYSFLGEGRSKGFVGKYDEEQLKMGIKIEYEHTSSALLSERIAKDHLAEIPDYYTRLKKMEEDAGVKE